MAAACLQTAAMPHPLRPETDRSSYTNQPPTWQLHAFRQLPPGLRKPSKEHFLMFHRCSTELFRGWTCLLDFCKLLANMGLWKIVNVSAFGKPDASKMMNVSAFLQNVDMPHDIPHIYICDFVELFGGVFFKTPYAIWICHTIFLIYIYICVSVKLIEFDMQHDIPHIYMCF